MVDVWPILAVGVIISSLIYPLVRISSASLSISIGLFVIFLFEMIDSRLINELAFSPLDLRDIGSSYTIFTSMFLHGGFGHIVFNVFILVLIGNLLEERIGSPKFLAIYIISGIGGGLVYALVNLGDNVGVIGASGAISGILGAIAILYPNQPFMLLFLSFRNIPAWVMVLIFLAMQMFIALSQTNIAWEAHIGGLATGILIAPLLMRISIEERVDRGEKIDVMVFAKTPKEREIAAQIKPESIRDVRNAWIDQLAETAKCPICGQKVRNYRGRIKCRNGHKFNI
ncbi:MAG TPA: rhomboid family intramembrane serine protease [Euryarchaeota archaeon]|nr:rhomboid family intramembrane serine protease [Euryarchaeota archaeon]